MLQIWLIKFGEEYNQADLSTIISPDYPPCYPTMQLRAWKIFMYWRDAGRSSRRVLGSLTRSKHGSRDQEGQARPQSAQNLLLQSKQVADIRIYCETSRLAHGGPVTYHSVGQF